ncbi:HAD family hydrolase [Mycolicibacterium frederiksbergense]|uniref:HAD family hydrolase n=1 Tax=Mycolicibacterium frederiksbergense TaxID=117567 RepID=UPI00265C6615|nr:HAD-IA family hydrolase [Mycolicibacterium frederiksbergense]MDO0976497.1 HAD-IA family hydrolase [Mycolicibacterium frederiksbergense]
MKFIRNIRGGVLRRAAVVAASVLVLARADRLRRGFGDSGSVLAPGPARGGTGTPSDLDAGGNAANLMAAQFLEGFTLATSAPEDEFATLRAVLDRDDLISTATSAQDVETAKPEPDIVHIALARAQVSPQRAVFVGDAVWDAQASVAAGVACIGVLSGGVSRAELEQAGAEVVFDNALDLCTHLADSPVQRLLDLR